VEEFLIDWMCQRLSKAGSGVLTAGKGGDLSSLILYENLPWETNILGRKAAALSLILSAPESSNEEKILEAMIAEAVDSVRDNGTELITAKVYTTDIVSIHALEQNGFLLMDTVVEAIYKYSEESIRQIRPSDFTLRLAGTRDIAELRGVAVAAFTQHFGRFHADPKIGQKAATNLYAEWIQSCIEGWGDWVFVAEQQNRIAGFSVWKKPSLAESKHQLNIGHYNIAAIHPEFCWAWLIHVPDA
jgi:hypothetical protein